MSVLESETETIDAEEFREAARRILADKVVRRAGWDQGCLVDGAALETEMTGSGWWVLTVPSAQGGLSQGFRSLPPLYEEMGRSLCPVGMVGTLAAIDVLAADQTAAATEVLERIVADEARLTFGALPCTEDLRVSGQIPNVWSVSYATDLLVLPDAPSGPVQIVDLKGPGVLVKRAETWDRGRIFVDIVLNGAAARPLAIDPRVAAQLVLAHSDLAIAWDSIGAAQQSLDETVAYMGTRQQFGRPIGSFQALKHRVADLKVGLELARALAVKASDSYADRTTAWEEMAGQARLLAVDAYRAIAEDSVQLHGGIGFTWEHDCHLFLKRALMNEMLGGPPERIRDRIASGIMSRALSRGI